MMDKMKNFISKKKKKYSICVLVWWFLVLLMMNTTIFAQQENKVDPELLDELVGNYEFKIQGQPGVFIFIAEEGKLKGAPAGEEPSLLEPVEGEDMTFEGHTPDGTKHLYKFLRDDEGRVAKCILSIPTMGLVVDMFRIEE